LLHVPQLQVPSHVWVPPSSHVCVDPGEHPFPEQGDQGDHMPLVGSHMRDWVPVLQLQA
jgi:hypothetical protein